MYNNQPHQRIVKMPPLNSPGIGISISATTEEVVKHKPQELSRMAPLSGRPIHIYSFENRAPLITYLEYDELKRLFPKIDDYSLPRGPLSPRKYQLPTHQLKAIGVKLAIRWFETTIEEPGSLFIARPQEMLAVYQAMALLGHDEQAGVMRMLENNLKAELEKPLDVKDAMRVWQLRDLRHTEFFIGLLFENLENYVDKAYFDTAEHRKLTKLSTWLVSDEVLMDEIRTRNLKWLGHAVERIGKKNQKRRAKRSAIKKYRPNLDRVDEQKESDEE